MLKYPLDPPHARILIASFSLGCSSEIIDILSLINSGPLFIDRSSDRESAALSRAKFIHRDGDHLTALNVLRAYIDLKTQDNKGVGKWLKDNHVNGKTIQHALKVREQLRELARRDGVDPGLTCGSESEVVGRCLLRGLFMNTAIVQSDGSYRQTAGSLVSLYFLLSIPSSTSPPFVRSSFLCSLPYSAPWPILWLLVCWASDSCMKGGWGCRAVIGNRSLV
jgi:HrpA-like RNA helicase